MKGRAQAWFWLRLALSAAAVSFVIWKLSREGYDLRSVTATASENLALLCAGCLALLPLNLGIEALKWKTLVKQFYPAVTMELALRAVLAGMASGIFTPNRIGEYAGRVLLLPEGHRLEALVLTFFDRIAQMLITILTGLLGFFMLLQQPQGQQLEQDLGATIWVLLLAAGGLLILISALLIAPRFALGWMLKPFRGEWAAKMRLGLEGFSAALARRITALSLLRWLVFSTQYLLLLYAFGFSGSLLQGYQMIAMVYLGKSLLPALAVAELGVREWVAIEVMGLWGLSAVSAFNSTFLLYCINFLLPTLAGAVVLLTQRIGEGKT